MNAANDNTPTTPDLQAKPGKVLDIPEDLLLSFRSMSELILDEQVRTMEDTILKVLEKHLGRKPARADAHRTKKISRDNVPDRFDLAFDDQLLGSISWSFDGNRFRVQFTPKASNNPAKP